MISTGFPGHKQEQTGKWSIWDINQHPSGILVLTSRELVCWVTMPILFKIDLKWRVTLRQRPLISRANFMPKPGIQSRSPTWRSRLKYLNHWLLPARVRINRKLKRKTKTSTAAFQVRIQASQNLSPHSEPLVPYIMSNHNKRVDYKSFTLVSSAEYLSVFKRVWSE